MKTIPKAVTAELQAMTPVKVQADHSMAIVITVTLSVAGVITAAVLLFGANIN